MKTEDIAVHDGGIKLSPTIEEPIRQTFLPELLWQRIALGAIALLAAVFNFTQLQNNGYANTYYTAAVKSMLQSWHNFFFVSFDPGGFVTVDKPPLGLWIQTLSAKIFGFSGFSIILPQALAGLISVILLYHLVQRYFKPNAGLIAALLFAITPISVALNRDNNLDPLLVLFLLIAAWFVMLAVDTGKLRWLLLCALMVGLGFNIKTLQAFLVVPAFGLLYLLSARHTWFKRVWHLLLALVLMAVVSLAWLIAVDMVPATQRPYVGSSQTNSEIELALGYNGLDRILGMGNSSRQSSGNTGSGQSSSASPMGGGGMGMMEGGPASPLRLFHAELGGQVSWMLPMALVGLCVLAWQTRLRLPLSRQHQAVVLWGVWLLVMAVFFSVASFFHSYYLVMIAPAICALAAIGLVLSWHEYSTLPITNWRAWALPVGLILTAAEQAYILNSYEPWKNFLTPIILVICIGAVIALGISKWKGSENGKQRRIVQRPAASIAVSALLLTSLIWSVISVIMPINTVLPTGGPTLMRSGGFPGGMSGGFPGGMPGGNGGMPGMPGGNSGMPGGNGGMPGGNGGMPGGNSGMPQMMGGMGGFMSGQATVDPKLLQYLQSNRGNAKYLLATTAATTAAPYIIETGEPVMAMGGFIGSDPILTKDSLAKLVKDGTVRFFMLQSMNIQDLLEQLPESQREEIEQMMEQMGGGNGGMQGGPFGGSQLSEWVQSNCKSVPQEQWQTQSSNSQSQQGGMPGGGMGETLYDCGAVR